MDFLISVLIFTCSLIYSLIKSISILVPLIIGMLAFSLTAFQEITALNPYIKWL